MGAREACQSGLARRGHLLTCCVHVRGGKLPTMRNGGADAAADAEFKL